MNKDKSVIQKIGFKEFSAICEEYQIVEKATKELLSLATDTETPIRTRVEIYKWVVEMNIGKPRQMNDISLATEPETAFLISHVSQDRVMFDLIEKVGGLENIIQALKEKGYQDIPDLEEFKQDDVPIRNIEDLQNYFEPPPEPVARQ